MDIDQYCRDVEAHLCRRNEGNLVRLVGPGFEMVRGWAVAGIPLRVALQGIDRRVDRAAAKGPRRHPIRVGFCEADVLDAFDAWRRAVGVYGTGGEAGAEAGDDGHADEAGVEPSRRGRSRESLATHLDRVIVRLTALRTGDAAAPWGAALDEIVRRLDALHPEARRARGDARDRLLADLSALDDELLERARGCADPALVAEAERDADAELQPFASRLTAQAFAAARRRSADRILRERLRLPALSTE